MVDWKMFYKEQMIVLLKNHICPPLKADYKLCVAVIQQESGFDPTIKSSAGAGGLGQFMPGTWASTFQNVKNFAKKWAAVGNKNFEPDLIDDRFNAYTALWCSVYYLECAIPTSLRYYNLPVTEENKLAAYNAGIQRVIDGSWKNITETVNYVKSIQAIKKTVK